MVFFSQLQTRQWCFPHNCRQDNGVFPSTLESCEENTIVLSAVVRKTPLSCLMLMEKHHCLVCSCEENTIVLSTVARQWCFSHNFRQDNGVFSHLYNGAFLTTADKTMVFFTQL
jgi:hypothetical protein